MNRAAAKIEDLQSTESLKDYLLKKDQEISNDVWMESLNKRKRAELEFHDQFRDTQKLEQQKSVSKDHYEEIYGSKKYYKIANESQGYVDRWIKTESKGKIFLDYACGNGHNALCAGSAGAELSVGLDISRVSVMNARRSAKEKALENTIFFKATAKTLPCRRTPWIELSAPECFITSIYLMHCRS